MLGLDGASWEFLRSPAVADHIPNLSRLLRHSACSTLLSTVPAYTAPAWTTITTGVEPGKHGVFGFTDASGRPVSDARVAVPRVWDYLERAGGRSLIMNVPLTYPPRPIAGCLISGMPTPPGQGFTWPEDLGADPALNGYVVDVPVGAKSREALSTVGRLEEMTRTRGRAAAQLMRRETWDLVAVVFVLPDRLGHPWWKHLVPGTPHFDSARGEQVRRAVARPLRALDEAAGELLGTLPSGSSVVTCSDHGFGRLDADVFFDLVLAGAGLIPGAPGSLRRALSGVARSRVGELVPVALKDHARARLSGRDGDRKAWTGPVYEGSVHLADPEDPATRATVTELLGTLTNPDGERIVKRVRDRAEVFSGPRSREAPELFPEMVSEAIELHDGLHAARPWVSRAKSAWGTHAREGIVAIAGAAASYEGHPPQAADVAVTLLDLLNLEAEGLDGRSLVSGGGSRKRVSATGSHDDAGVYDAEQEAAVMEHLKALGYVE